MDEDGVLGRRKKEDTHLSFGTGVLEILDVLYPAQLARCEMRARKDCNPSLDQSTSSRVFFVINSVVQYTMCLPNIASYLDSAKHINLYLLFSILCLSTGESLSTTAVRETRQDMISVKHESGDGCT